MMDNRNDQHPADVDDRLPIDPDNGRKLPPRAQPGYYPGLSTLAQQTFWDAATRETIRQRVHEVPPLRFFDESQSRLMQLLCDHLLPQDDRDAAHRIPIVPFIDQRLHEGRIPGYRFESMPPDGEAYRLGLQAIEQMARANHSSDFAALAWRDQEALLKSIHDAKPLSGAEPTWHRMPIHRWWALLLQDVAEVYYAHPWAWDEIGFGGPAYPRGYMRLDEGRAEPWEVRERRYEWRAPIEHWLSDPKKDDGIAAHAEHPIAGQGGTH